MINHITGNYAGIIVFAMPKVWVTHNRNLVGRYVPKQTNSNNKNWFAVPFLGNVPLKIMKMPLIIISGLKAMASRTFYD